MIGTKFGPYSIIGPLGAGGMGEVYRALDPRLGREVAVKIIGAGVASDPERQARFEREARAVSALNHPNILTVHDVGKEGDTSYLVCELVEGESLREHLGGGPLAVKELLDFAVQIADGLTAAHEAGIVHRDLKPENVMVTRAGLVKILDFGLAKLVTSTGQVAETATLSQLWSRVGAVQGTPPYMSPEQASGNSVDFRSDQFSLGVMLYEMAAGKRPFDRGTGVQTLAAIIDEEPQALASLNPKIPPPLRWLIERCLAKKPRDRYAATADLHRDLRMLRDRLPEATAAGGAVADVAGRPKIDRRLSYAAALVALVALLAIAALVWQFLSPHSAPSTYDFASFRFTPFATDTSIEAYPAWSPDGKSLAFTRRRNDAQQVVVQGLASPLGTQVTDLASGADNPFWAPDGTKVFFISRIPQSDRALFSVGAAGGPPEVVLEDVREASISPDGSALAFVRERPRGGLWISSPPGAEPKELFSPVEKRTGYSFPRFSPDGKKIGLRVRIPTGEFSFWVIDYPEGTARKRREGTEIDGGRGFSWMPDSRRLVGGGSEDGAGGHLWVLDSLEGTATPLTAGFGGAHSFPAVSPDGERVAFASTRSDLDLIEVPLDGSPVRTLLATARHEGLPSWSKIGNQLAYATDREGPPGIWLLSPNEGWVRPLVTTRDFAGRSVVLGSPSFSPDGRRIAYQAGVDTAFAGDLWISSAAGGPPVPLAGGKAVGEGPAWSPDGLWIAYVKSTPIRADLLKVAVGASGEPEELAEVYRGQVPHWSPKGDWISCNTQEGLTLVSPDGKSQRLLLAGERLDPHGWSRDGTTIYGLRDDQRLHTLLCAVDVATARMTTIGDLGPQAHYLGFSLHPDGKSFATTLARDFSDIWILDGLMPPSGRSARNPR